MSTSRRDFLASVGLLTAAPSWMDNLPEARDDRAPSNMDSYRWVLENRDVTFVAWTHTELDYISTLSAVSNRLAEHGASTRGVTMSKPIEAGDGYKYAFGLDTEAPSITDWGYLQDAVLGAVFREEVKP